MKLFTAGQRPGSGGQLLRGLLLSGLLPAAPALAQAPAWELATLAQPATAAVLNQSEAFATATDGFGNVFVAGTFQGQVTFGGTTLVSGGKEDFFVAKYVPGTGTWAWATRGGGTHFDWAYGLAVSGHSVYVVGTIHNSTSNANNVTLGGATPATSPQVQHGATYSTSFDLFLAKYTDQGSSAAFNWSQVGGGYNTDYGCGVAVAGHHVYVTGSIADNQANIAKTVFGGTGTTVGSSPQCGASTSSRPLPFLDPDLVLARYTDWGTSASFDWSQVGGGGGYDVGYGVAVSGSSVYVTGYLTNDLADSYQVLLGGAGLTAGTMPVRGVHSNQRTDLLLTKYTDYGSHAAPVWVQVAGGDGSVYGSAVAVSGAAVYVAGTLTNNVRNTNQVTFGGDGTTPGTSPQYGAGNNPYATDLLVARYTDNGSSATFNWSQVGGGEGQDNGQAIAVAGSSVWVSGTILREDNNQNGVLFGGSGATLGTVPVPSVANSHADLVVARYTDQVSSARLDWVQSSSGPGSGYGAGLAVGSTGLYVAGSATAPATFGSYALASPTTAPQCLVAGFGVAALPTPLAPGFSVFPNPSSGVVALTGAAPGAPVQVLNALGRVVATATASATGTALLDGLSSGLYLVRAGAATVRLVVE